MILFSVSLNSFIAVESSITLENYGMVESNISKLTGGKIENGVLIPDSIPGKVTYSYYCGGGKTINCTIEFSFMITKENFPDDNFRNWVLEQSYGKDGLLSPSEIADVTSIDVSGKSISDLTGIEYFAALTSLDCPSNNLTNLDLSKNTKLKNLFS